MSTGKKKLPMDHKRKAEDHTRTKRPNKKQKKGDNTGRRHHDTIVHIGSSQEHRQRIWRCARSQSNILHEFTQYDDPHRPQGLDLTQADALLAIASVWKGLEQRGVNFSFGDADFFTRQSRDAVVLSDHLILPIFFGGETPTSSSSAQPTKEPQSPHSPVLAIASRRDTNKTVRIRFTYFPSTYNTTFTGNAIKPKKMTLTAEQVVVDEMARALVKGSNWAIPLDGRSLRYDRSKDVWRNDIPTVAVSADVDTTAIHLVLNAWAFMLDIPLARRTLVRAEDPNSEFYVNALSLIRLACDGRVTEPTIRDFMQEYHYAATEPTASEKRSITDGDELENLAEFQSVFMSNVIFDRVVAYHRENPTATGAPSSEAAQIKDTSQTKDTSHTTDTSQTKDKGQAPRSKTAWQEILDSHSSLKQEANRSEHSQREEEMRDDEVSEGVALLWRSLWENGKRFGFGSNATYQIARSGGDIENQFKVIGRNHDKLIMPLTGYNKTFEVTHKFPESTDPELSQPHGSETKALGKKKAAKSTKKLLDLSVEAHGHHVLVVAERNKDNRNNVHLVVMDSRPITCKAENIQVAAQSVVITSGWMGLDNNSGKPITVAPQFSVEHRKVPLQIAINSCGLHTILNAWAYMLEIPVVQSLRRRNKTATDAEFYRYGYAILQLAYEGSVDTRLIQAYLNHYGYSEEQDAADKDEAVLPLQIEAQTQFELTTYLTDQAMLWE
ncbi:hypothetical protein MMC18_003795 [Xylographa bjoerkii]|nr:hypothetical protein [Xylographa bjoerkii]